MSSTRTSVRSWVAPASDPKIAVLVIVDEAEKRPDYGSVTAAPFAKQILQLSLDYRDMCRRRQKDRGTKRTVPAMDGMDIKNAEAALKEKA